MRLLSLVLLCVVAPLYAEPLSADEIMQRVAANQDSAQELRSAYVYHQKVRIRSLDSKGKVRHEETSEYTALPDPLGTKKDLVSVSGRYLRKGKYVTYDQKELDKSDGFDIEMVRELKDELTNDEKSRDGLNRELFPLSSSEIAKYTFQLKGQETWQHLRAYRIAFQPKTVSHEFDIDSSEGPWAGEALIGAEEFQPLEVVTKLAQKVPMAVKILLGTNIHGLGFTVRYQKVEGGAWFPVSYGTEFSFRVLFGWARTVTLALDNSGFQKVDVSSTVKFAEVK